MYLRQRPYVYNLRPSGVVTNYIQGFTELQYPTLIAASLQARATPKKLVATRIENSLKSK